MPKPYPSSGARRVKEAQASKPIRVLVAAQHALVRAGIRALVEQIPGIEVVADVAEGYQTLQLIKEHRPDILLLDVILPSVSALDSLKKIVDSFPSVRVIVLTLHANEEYAVQAFRAGASGYIPKSAASAELEKAIKSVASGENYLGSELSQMAVLKYLKDPRAILSELTARQREVLKMIAEGHATKEIAQRLNISVKTVETHRAQIMERLNIHDVVGLVRYSLRIGLVRLDD
jgi:DNA-binding NarL/FixJ family response regulator